MARHRSLTKALGPEDRSPGAVVPTEYVPFRERRVKTLNVACPTCRASVGDRCVTAAGVQTKSHPVRRRMAIRAGW